jgi:hypothetical protein
MPVLEPEQEHLFTDLVEASRSVPRAERQPFMYLPFLGGARLQGNGYNAAVLEEDLHVLSDAGLIRITNYHSGNSSGFNFIIPPHALQYYQEIKSGEAAHQIEQDVMRYLDAPAFQQQYPAAWDRWTGAAELLWRSDSPAELSTIGHKCREAVQEFVTALINLHGISGANPDRAKTRDRFSAVLSDRRDGLGASRSELLDALFSYWKAACDLIQRQEHAGQREGEPLVWEDGRRVVFQTAVLMFEIARSF